MKIITGDEFGLIKLFSTQSKKLLDQYGIIDSTKSILNIFTNKIIESHINSEENINNNEENDENLDLYISSITENYILEWNKKRIISTYKNENKNTSFISSAIKFPSQNNDKTIFVNASSDDKINVVSFNKENKYENSSTYWPVDNSNKFLKIKLRAVSNSSYNNNESIYCLYQSTPLVLYNIEQQKVEFKGKNLPHDELGLRIPIHDTDLVEIKNNPRLNYTSTAYGEIRLYDKKASPKPSMSKTITKSKINKIDITEDNNYLFVGDTQGYCAMLDIRKSFHPCKTFRGNNGSIKSLVNIDKNNTLIVGGFDRYVRWYDYKSGNNDKIFLKNKINSTVLVELEPEKKIDFENEEEESEIDDSELKEDNEEDIEEENDEENSEENSEENEEEEDENKKINKRKEKDDDNEVSEEKVDENDKDDNNEEEEDDDANEDKENDEEIEEKGYDVENEEDNNSSDENELKGDEEEEFNNEIDDNEEEEESQNNKKRKRRETDDNNSYRKNKKKKIN